MNGPKWIEWTEWDQIGPYRTKMDQIGPMQIEQKQSGQNVSNRTKVDKMDRIGPKWTE